MRSDMDKVLVERPRVNHWVGRRLDSKGRQRAYQRDWQNESLPIRERIVPRDMRWQRYLNENLAPLRRYLGQQVGRPWRKIYSEVCEHFGRNNPVQLHIFQHMLKDFVVLEPFYDAEGVAHRELLSKFSFPVRRFEYYVDPHGILRRGTAPTWEDLARARREALKREPPAFIPLGKNRIAKQNSKGIWFEVTLSTQTPDTDYFRDVWFSKEGHGNNLIEYGNDRAYAVSKRALNRKEIAALPK